MKVTAAGLTLRANVYLKCIEIALDPKLLALLLIPLKVLGSECVWQVHVHILMPLVVIQRETLCNSMALYCCLCHHTT